MRVKWWRNYWAKRHHDARKYRDEFNHEKEKAELRAKKLNTERPVWACPNTHTNCIGRPCASWRVARWDGEFDGVHYVRHPGCTTFKKFIR